MKSVGAEIVVIGLATMRQATPLLYAAMGGILSERSGVVNIGLEGMMLTGAFVGVWAGQAVGPAGGFACAVLAGAAVGVLHWLMTQRFRLNHVVSGVAINLLALNVTTFLLRRLFNQATPRREAELTSLLNPVPWIILALILPWVLQKVLWDTPLGLRIRSVGESPEDARMAGLRPDRLRLFAVAASGALAAIGGSTMSVSQSGQFSDDMISGRGYIALAAVICGGWRPIPAALACIVFGLTETLQIQLQGVIPVPGELLRAIPYLLALTVAALLRPRPPAALGVQTDSYS